MSYNKDSVFDPSSVHVLDPSSVHVVVPSSDDVFHIYFSSFKKMFNFTTENLIIIMEEAVFKFRNYETTCDQSNLFMLDIANELFHYSCQSNLIDTRNCFSYQITKPCFYHNATTMTLLAVLLILHKEMIKAYEVLMHVTANGDYNDLVTALILHMCEQDIGIAGIWVKQKEGMIEACKGQNVQQKVIDFANALLHHE